MDVYKDVVKNFSDSERKKLLHVENLCIQSVNAADDDYILRNITFSISQGQSVSLIGDSGSGKTLTALSILGLLPSGVRHVTGTIIFKERVLNNGLIKDYSDIRGNRISLILQDPQAAMNPVFTVGTQIRDMIMSHMDKNKKQAQEHCLHMLHEVGFSEPIRIFEMYPHQLSGGMAQRILIAKALSCNPELLIADEPTTALDSCSKTHILNLLKSLQVKYGLSLLYISHDIEICQKISSYFIHLNKGTILEQGRFYGHTNCQTNLATVQTTVIPHVNNSNLVRISANH